MFADDARCNIGDKVCLAGACMKKYLVKMGMIFLSIKDESVLSLVDDLFEDFSADREYYKYMARCQGELFELIKGTPEVKNVRRFGDVVIEHYEPFTNWSHDGGGTGVYVQQSSSYIYFEAFIPRGKRASDIEIRYEDRVVERFNILYNGLYFIVFTEVCEGVSTINFSQAARDYLCEILTTSKWDAVCAPPCPLQLDFVINLGAQNEFPEKVTGEAYRVTVDMPEVDDIATYVEYLISRLWFDMEMFLSLKTMERKIELSMQELDDDYKKILESFSVYIGSSWWRVFKKIKLMKEIQALYVAILSKSSEISALSFDLDKEKARFKSPDAKNGYDVALYPFYYKHFERKQPVEKYITTVKDINSVVGGGFLQYYTVFAAAFGSVFGYFASKLPDFYAFVKAYIAVK